MKSITYKNYGPPDILKYEDIEKPIVGENEVLIKVRAASVNPLDWHFMRGIPYFLRILTGLRKPKAAQLGVDVSGVVETVGAKVTKFKPGDEVFGTCRGAFAEYACAKELSLAMKPGYMTFEQAASVPIAAITALQGLRNKIQIKHGQKVLINGASGGVGTFAVHIAKSFGADVTGVCSGRNVELVKSIGANQVIDYTKKDFTQSGLRYDLILDCVGNHSFFELKRVLNSKGSCISIGGTNSKWMIGSMISMMITSILSRFVSQNFIMILAKMNEEDLIFMSKLIESGKVSPVIDKIYKLSETGDAISYLEEGHARGKVVITLEENI